MKAKMMVILLSILVFNAAPVFAQQAQLNKSAIHTISSNRQVFNLALGQDSAEYSGAINIRVAKITKTTIVNSSGNEQISNAAVGKRSQAHAGSMGIY